MMSGFNEVCYAVKVFCDNLSPLLKRGDVVLVDPSLPVTDDNLVYCQWTCQSDHITRQMICRYGDLITLDDDYNPPPGEMVVPLYGCEYHVVTHRLRENNTDPMTPLMMVKVLLPKDTPPVDLDLTGLESGPEVEPVDRLLCGLKLKDISKAADPIDLVLLKD